MTTLKPNPRGELLGSKVTDGVLTGTVVQTLGEQALVQVQAGALVWLHADTLKVIPDWVTPKTFDEVLQSIPVSCKGPKASDSCNWIGCDDIAVCKGFCNKHYKQDKKRRAKAQEEDGW